MDAFRQDIRYSLRSLTRSPGFTVGAVLTLAVGIGATTAIFSIVYPTLIEPLPYPEPDRLVWIQESRADRTGRSLGASAPNIVDWRRDSELFERISSYTQTTAVVRVGELPRRLSGALVAVDFFDLLGVAPRGRGFIAAEGRVGGPAAVILSHEYWSGPLGADDSILGAPLELGDRQVRVVGVLPPDFRFPEAADFWLPQVFTEQDVADDRRGARYLGVVGRLKPGVSVEQGASELNRLTHQASFNEGFSVLVRDFREHVAGEVRAPLMTLLAAVSLLLLIGCANAAGLLLSRAADRQREMGLRAALGADRSRLLRQLLVESVLLAVVAGSAGVVLTLWLLDPLLRLAPRQLPQLNAVSVDGAVLAFGLALSCLTGILFGVLPALQAVNRPLEATLRRSTLLDSGLGGRLRSLLVVGEVALSVVLLVGAGLMMHSFVRLNQVELGFAPQGVTTFSLSLPGSRYDSAQGRARVVDRLRRDIGALTEVSSVGASTNTPLSGSAMTFGFRPLGGAFQDQGQQFAQYHATTPGYFETLGIALRSGRTFEVSDGADAEPVVIVNQTVADSYWPGGDAVGRYIDSVSQGGQIRRRIVGVVTSVKHGSLAAGDVAELYVPFAQDSWAFVTFTVRTSVPSPNLTARLRQVVAAADPMLPLDGVGEMARRVEQATAGPRFLATLLGVFSVTALVLAVLGLYAVLSFSVARGRQAIGLRLVLGAHRRQILNGIVGRGVGLTLAGLAIGLAGALATSRLLATQLFEVQPVDPLTLAAVCGLLLATATAACLLPARRAARLDPVAMLRE